MLWDPSILFLLCLNWWTVSPFIYDIMMISIDEIAVNVMIILFYSGLGWTIYGAYVKDPFVLVSNTPGTIVTVYYCFQTFRLEWLRNERKATIFVEACMYIIAYQTIVAGMHGVQRRGVVLPIVPLSRSLTIIIVWKCLLHQLWLFSFHRTSTKNEMIIFLQVNSLIGNFLMYGSPLSTVQTVFRQKRSNSIDPYLSICILLSGE